MLIAYINENTNPMAIFMLAQNKSPPCLLDRIDKGIASKAITTLING
jgi:hypothetical protein